MKDELIYLVTLAPEGNHELNIMTLMLEAGFVVQLVLLVLFGSLFAAFTGRGAVEEAEEEA